MQYRSILFLLFAISFPASAQNSISYIANEGIFIQSENKHILIDAIFDDYYDTYAAPTDEKIRQLNTKEPPYENVDLLLVTHAHLDHFNPKMVSEFLKSHAETELICPKQAIDSIVKSTNDMSSFAPRLNGIDSKTEWKALFLKDVSVHTAFVRHGGKRNYDVANQIYLINIDGKKILHIGDAEMEPAHFSQLHLSKPQIDVALIPYWFLAYPPGIEIIKNQIKPIQLVAIHYPKVGDPKSLQKIKEHFPDAIVFKEEGEFVAF